MKLRFGATIVVLCIVASTTVASQAYVGARVPPLPTECKEVGNGILPSQTHSIKSMECSGVRMEWLLARAAVGGYWEVKDVIVYPKLSKRFEPTRLDCSFDGAKDETIIAVVTKWRSTKGGGESAMNISRAWRPDLKAEKFQVLPVKRVACGYDQSRV